MKISKVQVHSINTVGSILVETEDFKIQRNYLRCREICAKEIRASISYLFV
jgi:hypothetical protein